MKLLFSTIVNILLTCIWSVPLIVLWFGFLSDIDETETFWIILGVAVVNAFITAMIHLIIFLPGLLIHSIWKQNSSLVEIYYRIYPGLLIPLGTYIGIVTLIFQAKEITQETLVIIAFIGMGFMLVHSLSLYIFLFNISPFKITNDEKNIESSL